MTPSAKADGFSGNGPLAVNARWPHPGQATCKDIPCCVNISLERQATMRTIVLADRKGFPDNRSTSTTFLTRSSCVDSYHRDTGAFSLVTQGCEEAIPRDIRNRPGKPVILEHSSNVQAFHRDKPVATDKFQCGLMSMLVSKVFYPGMNALQFFDRFLSIFASLLFSAYKATGTTKSRQFLFLVSWVGFMFSVGCGVKMLKADIDSNGRIGTRFDMNFSEVAGQDNVPLASLALQCRRLDDALDLSMLFDSDLAHVLNSQFTIRHQSNPISVGRKLDAVKAICGLEARIAWLIPILHAPEECDEGFIETTHRGLGGGEVETGKIGVGIALRLEPRRLLVVTDASPLRFVGGFPLLQTRVIKTSMRFEGDTKFTLLVGIGKQTEFVSPAHSLSLLILYVTSDAGFRDGAARTGIIATAPQSWQTRTERRKFSAEIVRSAPLETVDKFRNAKRGIGFDEQVDVIRHDFQGMNLDAKLSCDFVEQLCHPQCYVAYQNGTTVFWTPDKVVLQGENRTGVLSVSAPNHKYTISIKLTKVKRGARFLRHLKETVPSGDYRWHLKT